MKKTLALIALFVSAQAQAGLGIEGRYKGVAGDCTDFPRVYVSVKPSAFGPKGTMAVVINKYGEDAAMEEVLLGSGQRQAPGTSVEAHGMVTEAWNTTMQNGSIVCNTTVTRPSIGLRYSGRTIVAAQGNRLSIENLDVNANGQVTQNSKCVLERY